MGPPCILVTTVTVLFPVFIMPYYILIFKRFHMLPLTVYLKGHTTQFIDRFTCDFQSFKAFNNYF